MCHQNPIILVKYAHIGNRPQRHQIQITADLGTRFVCLSTNFCQISQHIKRHAHTHQRFTGKITAQLIGIYHRIGIWRCFGCQMMVGNNHHQAMFFSTVHPCMARNAIIHGYNHIWLISRHTQIHDFRGQTITIFKTVRH